MTLEEKIAVPQVRVLTPGLQSGAYNTYLDIVVQEQVAKSESPPTLIFSEWKPTVSLGISQSKVLDVNEVFCQTQGIDIVRRRSGGKSVLLNNDYLVFSMIYPRTLHEDLDTFQTSFYNFLISTLQSYAMPALFIPKTDIVVADENGFIRQIGNSAGMFHKDSVVFHGSLRLRPDSIGTMAQALQINGNSVAKYENGLRRVLASVCEYSDVTSSQLRESFIEIVSQLFQMPIQVGDLTPSEKVLMDTIPEEFLLTTDKSSLSSRGICNLHVNGSYLLPELEKYGGK